MTRRLLGPLLGLALSCPSGPARAQLAGHGPPPASRPTSRPTTIPATQRPTPATPPQTGAASHAVTRPTATGSPLPSRAAQPSAEVAALTSGTWQPDEPPRDLFWELLRLPERVFRLALSPLYPLVYSIQRFRLDQRVYDLLTNDAGTIMVIPLVFFLGSDGFGAGLHYSHHEVFGREDQKLSLAAGLYTNLDYAVKGHYEQASVTLNGRRLALEAGYETDDNVRYYGIGGATTATDERGLHRDLIDASAKVDLLGPQFSYLESNLALRYRHEQLSSGHRSGVPSLGEVAGDEALLPPGFDRDLDYLEGRLSLGIDRREPAGRTTSGWTTNLDVGVQHDLNGAELSAVDLALSGAVYALVLPRYRVLVLAAGAAAAFPWGDDETVPLGGYVSLGRKTHLRGYARDRFLDRYAWWASAEYRYPIIDYPIHQYLKDELTISFTIFADIARAGEDLSELFGTAPRWSSGFGLHFATATYDILLLQLGFSPEGLEITFTFGNLPI